jgi:rhodanese-related sulfurtransferase
MISIQSTPARVALPGAAMIRPSPAAGLLTPQRVAQPERRGARVAALPGLPDFLKKKEEEDDDFVGFVFDPSMQRWIRSKNVEASKGMTQVVPLSGDPYTVWPVMHTFLTRKKLKSVTQDEVSARRRRRRRAARARRHPLLRPVSTGLPPTPASAAAATLLSPASSSSSAPQALALVSRGAALLDVRLAVDFEKEHAAGAVNAPLFRITAGNNTWDKIKRVVMAGLVMRATERDPGFAAAAAAAVGGNKRKRVVVMCAVGGTLDTVVRVASTGKVTATDRDRSFGRETRSLKACYELLKAGFTDVVHLQGGLQEWRYKGYPLADE